MLKPSFLFATCILLAGCSSTGLQPHGEPPDGAVPDGEPVDVGAGDGAEPDLGLPPRMGLTITVTGALEGVKETYSPSTEYAISSDGGYTIYFDPGLGPIFKADLKVTYQGEPQTGIVYTQDTPGVTCELTVESFVSPGASWAATRGITDKPDRGTCSLEYTSALYGGTGHGVKVFDEHGSMKGTLEPLGSATGRVDLSADF